MNSLKNLQASNTHLIQSSEENLTDLNEIGHNPIYRVLELLNNPEEIVAGLQLLYESTQNKEIGLKELIYFDLINILMDLTTQKYMGNVRELSYKYIYFITRYNKDEKFNFDSILHFCFENIKIPSEFQYFNYLIISNLFKYPKYRDEILKILPTVFENLRSIVLDETKSHCIYVLLSSIAEEKISHDLAVMIVQSVSPLPLIPDCIRLIFNLQIQYNDIIFNFDYQKVIDAIYSNISDGSGSLMAINLLTQIIHCKIDFHIEINLLLSQTENPDVSVQSASLFCISELVRNNTEIIPEILNSNVFSFAESKKDSPVAVTKSAAYLVANLFIKLTNNQILNYSTPASLYILVQSLEYDDSRLTRKVIKALSVIMRPGCGKMFDKLVEIFEEHDVWSTINDLISTNMDEKTHSKLFEFFHNYYPD